MRKSSFWIGISFIFVILCFVASFPVLDIGNFYSHLHSFSYDVRNHNRDDAQKGLENLKGDYNVFSSWKLQYFADRYLFDKTYRYEAAVSILNENYEKAENEDLKNREDDYYTSYMLGIAKFKVLHLAFQQAKAKKDKKQMTVILGLILEEVRLNFEKCVKEGPGPAGNFNCSFDYDLTSDPKSALKALMSQKPKQKFILGLPDNQDKDPGNKKPSGKKPDKKGPPQLSPGEKKEASQGGAKKVG